ncbi:MAG: phosphate signaling complex protein PhoU [Rhodomicrobium sp.]|jgi:phosphate transport system protein
MNAHTVASFDQDLKSLDAKISRMGGMTEEQLKSALGAIAQADPERALEAVAADAAIDAMQREIEECAVQMIARRQPVAVDLRSIVGATRIAGDLERIGDMAKNIAKRIGNFDEKAWLSPMTKSIGGMGDVALWQLKTVLDSYSQRNTAMALKVWHRDEEIDRRYDSLFRELLTYMMEDTKKISYAAHLLFCGKNIERIGDHCTNIAESVAYIVNGQTIADGRPRYDALAHETAH